MHGGSINTDDGERRNARRVAKVQMARLSTRMKNRQQPPTKEGGTVGHFQRKAKLRGWEWRRMNWKKMR